jgi:predicted AAA+ superfamily ATPase
MRNKRYLEKPVAADLEDLMVLLSGPRQCGKTTFSKWILEKEYPGEYLNWDQPKDRKRIVNQDWSENSKLVVLDEIHKKPGWKNFLKGVYDTKPKNMHFLATGSARLEFFQKSGDSMFGRFRPWRLHPFCLAEDPLELQPQERFERMLERGGFPHPYLAKNKDEAQRWRIQRWSLLLREDLRDLESIRNIQSLELLAELLRSHASGMISYKNLAEDAEIAPKTAKTWIHALEKLYLVFLVSPYSKTIKRALSKTPKLYFLDPGDLLEQSEGVRIENLVALNLLKRLNFIEDAYGDRLALHYVRDKEGREVDFLITSNQKPVALIEVKRSYQEPDPSLLYFRDRLTSPVCIQLHSECAKRSVIKQGVRIQSLQSFFGQPLDTRKFWEVG